MKRSEINEIIRDAMEFIRECKFYLPPFAYWPAQDWMQKGSQYDEIRDNMLGWDITDFGLGDFHKTGLVIFAIRNGNFDAQKYPKPYAEKLLVVREEQVTPYHFHWSKMEDIINRGGGNLMIKVYNSAPDETLSHSDVEVCVDACRCVVKAGSIIKLTPGESITLTPGMYHSFWGEKGTGRVLVGEVSKVNDDKVDNRFLDSVGRFPDIEEDVPPTYLLCNEYGKCFDGQRCM